MSMLSPGHNKHRNPIPSCFDNKLHSPSSTEVTSASGVSTYTVCHMDVGQGDCTILAANGEVYIIDAGRKTAGGNAMNRYISLFGEPKQDLHLIITHADGDHYEGFFSDNFKKVYTHTVAAGKNVFLYTSEQTKNDIEKENGPISGLGVRYKGEFKIANSPIEIIGYSERKTTAPHIKNDQSPCIVLTSLNSASIFLGDMTVDMSIVDKLVIHIKKKWTGGSNTSQNLVHLMIPHHGSFYSYDPLMSEIRNKLNCKVYCVISCGGTLFDHPHEETTSDLSEWADRIYVTNLYKYHNTGDGMGKMVIAGNADIYGDMIFYPDINSVLLPGTEYYSQRPIIVSHIRSTNTSLLRASSLTPEGRGATEPQLKAKITKGKALDLESDYIKKLKNLNKDQNQNLDHDAYIQQFHKDFIAVKVKRVKRLGTPDVFQMFMYLLEKNDNCVDENLRVELFDWMSATFSDSEEKINKLINDTIEDFIQ